MALDLGRRTNTVVRQNLAWAITVISLLLLMSLGGWLTLTMAVVGHEGSTLLGVVNGLRLLRRPVLPERPPARTAERPVASG
jgi:Cd2+/Zn2+-exporting ATPase